MKKKLMKTTENMPMPMSVIKDAADPMTFENADTFSSSVSFCASAVSILKSLPSFGKDSLRNSLKWDRGTAMFFTEASMLDKDIPLTMPLTIGIMTVITDVKITDRMSKVNTASTQSGAFHPLILTPRRNFIIGFATNETTTAIRM